MSLRKVPAAALYVSEPAPQLFGNPPNEQKFFGLPIDGASTWTNSNWLKSRFHFSFAEYSNPRNASFGVLRVMNDDLVQPSRGFGAHPHRDMEICTYVVEGELTHQDSLGTRETLGRGSVQFMTAGRGVRHSEHNLSADRPLRFIQSWIVPRARGLPPNYGSVRGDADLARARRNKWVHLLSDADSASADTPVKVAQDVNLFVTELDAGAALPLVVGDGRQAYLLCVEGAAAFRTEGDSRTAELERHDAMEILGRSATPIEVAAGEAGAHILYFEMAAGGRGRSDL